MLLPRAIATQGVGFIPGVLARQGFMAVNQRDGGGGKRLPLSRNRGKTLRESAEEIEALLDGRLIKTDVRKVAGTVRRYSQADSVGASEVGDALNELQAADTRLRAELIGGTREQNLQVLAVLEQITVLLAHVQDDEDAVLVLLLSEP